MPKEKTMDGLTSSRQVQTALSEINKILGYPVNLCTSYYLWSNFNLKILNFDLNVLKFIKFREPKSVV